MRNSLSKVLFLNANKMVCSFMGNIADHEAKAKQLGDGSLKKRIFHSCMNYKWVEVDTA
jgi:hypothetical protein